VNADEREEIAASVAAHAELGPRYESAVAEGLVERIGEEIDRRVDARLRGMGHPGTMGQQSGMGQQSAARQAYLSPGQQIVPPGYHGGQQATQPPAAAQAAPAPPPSAAPARRGGGVTGLLLGLGSMGLGVGATAVVVIHHVATVAALFMVILIWLAIMGINIAHSQRR
jgi:hypothetical protein